MGQRINHKKHIYKQKKTWLVSKLVEGIDSVAVMLDKKQEVE